MNLRDMKQKKTDTDDGPCCVGESSEERYPWGLRINLGNQELEKLGIDISGMAVGDSVAIFAKATITSKNENEREDDGEVKVDRDCSLQIKELAIEPAEEEEARPSTVRGILQKAKDSL